LILTKPYFGVKLNLVDITLDLSVSRYYPQIVKAPPTTSMIIPMVIAIQPPV
jgi:hypothetical protein